MKNDCALEGLPTHRTTLIELVITGAERLSNELNAGAAKVNYAVCFAACDEQGAVYRSAVFTGSSFHCA